jgi:hypothetical protein
MPIPFDTVPPGPTWGTARASINDNFELLEEAVVKDSGRLPVISGRNLTEVPELYEDVFNPKNYNASGRGDIHTTGAISASGTSLVVASTATFAIGQGIAIYGAGTLGVNLKILVTKITNIVGTTITVQNAATYTVSGARVEHSDHEALQLAINAMLYPNNTETTVQLGRLKIPPGIYITHKPLHFGYGENFKSYHVYGGGPRFTGIWNYNGTCIHMKNGAEPAITINGARSATFTGITFLGLNRTWVESNGLGGNVGTPTDETITDWIDPAIITNFPNCNSRHAPYCGIAIDAYAGTRPGTSYPDMVIPAWMANQTQYGRNSASSEIKFENCTVEGFVASLVNQPAAYDGNGDFINFDKCMFYAAAYGVSWGNTNARLLGFNTCNFQRIHTALVTNVHGMQTGKPDVACYNCAFELVKKWFSFPTLSYGGTPTFHHCRSEQMYRIGEGLQSVILNPAPITFTGCEFGLGWNIKGVPSDIISNEGPTHFEGCVFSPTAPEEPSVMQALPFDVRSDYLQFTNCTLATGYDATTYAQKIAINAVNGILCRNLGTDVQGNWLTMNRWNLNTGARIGPSNNFTYQTKDSKRQTCLNVYAKVAKAADLGNLDPGIPIQITTTNIPKSGLAYSISGRTLTVTGINKSSPQYTFKMQGGDVGDLVYDQTTKTFFVVASWDHSGATGTWKLFALNNYSAAQVLTPTFTNADSFYILLTRLYTPSTLITGDLTNADDDVTNVQNGAGTATTADNDNTYAVGDFYQVIPLVDNTLNELNNHIVSTGSGTIKLGWTVNYTQAKRRFGLFVRKSPANDT